MLKKKREKKIAICRKGENGEYEKKANDRNEQKISPLNEDEVRKIYHVYIRLAINGQTERKR